MNVVANEDFKLMGGEGLIDFDVLHGKRTEKVRQEEILTALHKKMKM